VPAAVRAPFFPAKGALAAPFGMLACGEPGSIDIQNQQALGGRVVLHGLTFAQVNGADCCTSLLDMALCKTIEGSGNGGWLREALESPRLGQSSIGSNAGINVTDRLAATHNAHQAGEEFVLGRIQHLFLRQLELLR